MRIKIKIQLEDIYPRFAEEPQFAALGVFFD